jgi:PAS domain S-box-containing protein
MSASLQLSPQGDDASDGLADERRARATAETALRASEERLELAMEISRAYFFEWEPQTDRVTRSDSCAAILGLNGEAAINDTSQGYFQRIEPADQGQLLTLVRSLTPALDRYRTEYRLTRGDGQTIVVEETARAFFDTNGQLQRLVGVVADITERKRNEALLAEHTERLREADRRKDEFLAMLAHELRNPLAPIVNAIELLKTGVLDGAQLAWCRDLIERQTQHLTRVVDDLLDISRITRGKIELQKEPLDVATIVERALETCRPLIAARGHRLRVELPPEPAWVEGDLVRLAQVISNLLTNAVKYTDRGGLIGIEVTGETEEVNILVRDNGRGLDPALAPQLFDLFFQAERTLDRAEGGLGLGLPLVRSLVGMHGGRVQASSAGLGRGSEFLVSLPRLTAETPAPPAPAAASPPPRDRPLILVADDNRDVTDSLALLLNLQGWVVRTAYDGPAALTAALAEPPRVILLDIGLPGLDGYSVARTIRAEPTLADTWLIAVTGYGQPEDRERSAAAGFDTHLVKPLAWTTLEAVLAQAVQGPRPGRTQPSPATG